METDGLKKTIIKALKAADDSIALKKLRKAVTEDKKAFKEAWSSLLAEARVMEIDGLGVRLSKKRKKEDKKNTSDESTGHAGTAGGGDDGEMRRKTKKVKEDEEDGHLSSTRASNSSTSSSSSGTSMYPDLWTTAEQMWRDQSMDQTYLDTNPDSITRLFIGNLNKNVTEEQLRSTIDGITYIKWITDKTTRQFYGTTYVEVD